MTMTLRNTTTNKGIINISVMTHLKMADQADRNALLRENETE